ncbi:unnamed protein product, partial [Ascophyllum nodosum]
VIPSVGACPNEGSPGEQQHSVSSGGGLRALLGRSFIGMFEVLHRNGHGQMSRRQLKMMLPRPDCGRRPLLPTSPRK